EALPGKLHRPNNEIDIVFAVTIEAWTGCEGDDSAIEAHMCHADFCRLREHLLMKTLAASHHRSEDRHFLGSICRGQVRQDLLGSLRGNLQITLRAVLHTDFGIEQA